MSARGVGKMENTYMAIMGSLMLLAIFFGCSGSRGERNISAPSGLLDCPDTPNCVSSLAKNPKYRVEPFILRNDPQKSWDMVQKTIGSLPRTTLVTQSDTEIHAECRSMIFRFVDDLMAQLSPSKGIVNIRSASRNGYYDFGVNRRRIENLRKILRQNGVIE